MPDYRIVFLDADTVGDVPALKRFEELGAYAEYAHTLPEQVPERIQGQQIVITNKVPLSAEVIKSTSSLQLICVAATGMNNVALSAAAQHDVVVKNVENYSTHSVAQVTVGLVLNLLHRFDYYDDYVKSKQYSQQPLFTHLGHRFWQLKGKQWGIIGLGNIGQQVAQIGEALGARVAYYSTSGKNNNAACEQQSLEELLQSSDVLTIHAPLNERTENLLSYEQLSMMPRHALLVNTSRGGIINEADLVRALDEERIARAAVDAFSAEPLPLTHPYLRVKHPERLLLTPHIGWASHEARTLLMDRVFDHLQQFIKGDSLK